MRINFAGERIKKKRKRRSARVARVARCLSPFVCTVVHPFAGFATRFSIFQDDCGSAGWRGGEFRAYIHCTPFQDHKREPGTRRTPPTTTTNQNVVLVCGSGELGVLTVRTGRGNLTFNTYGPGRVYQANVLTTQSSPLGGVSEVECRVLISSRGVELLFVIFKVASRIENRAR